MGTDSILKEIRKDLERHVDKKYKAGAENYFKETVCILGVRTPIVRKIAVKYWQKIMHKSKEAIFEICGRLLKTGFSEEATIAFSFALKLKKQYARSDFERFEGWLKRYVSDWACCDDLCAHAFGEFLFQFQEFLPQLNGWAKSKSRWERRASAVILISCIRRDKKFLKKVFEIAEILLEDNDDLVQKGYGWLLKEASKKHQKEVFAFVVKNKKKMPRTALRYAIEKMPENLKENAMKRD